MLPRGWGLRRGRGEEGKTWETIAGGCGEAEARTARHGRHSRGLRSAVDPRSDLDPREQPCSPDPSRIPGTGPWGLQRVGDREEKGWRSRVRRKEVAQRCQPGFI